MPKKVMNNSYDHEISSDKKPFTSAADGTVAFDFLISCDSPGKHSSAK